MRVFPVMVTDDNILGVHNSHFFHIFMGKVYHFTVGQFRCIFHGTALC